MAAEQLPKDPTRRAAEIRYRSNAFGPGPESARRSSRPFRLPASTGVNTRGKGTRQYPVSRAYPQERRWS